MKPLSTAKVALYSTANLGASMVYQFANMGFPLFLSVYPISNLVVGFLAQERSFVGGFVQPIVGAISDRFPPNPLGRRRPFFLIGVPLTAASLLFLAGYPDLWAVIVVMTFFSFFLAVATDPYLAMLPNISPPEQRGLIGAVMAVFNMVGAIVVIAVAFFFWNTNQELVFAVVAAGLVVTFGVTFFTVSEPPEVQGERLSRLSINLLVYARAVVARPNLMRYLVAVFFFWLGNGGITPFLTRFAVQVLGAQENVAFLLVLPAIVSSAVFAIPAGIFAARVGKKRVLLFGMALFGISAAVGAQIVQGMTEAMLLMPIVGIANAITSSLITPLLADLMPPQRAGEFMGVGSLLWSFAQPLGALGAGAIADVTGNLRLAFVAGGLAMLLAFALLKTVETPIASTPSPQA